MHDWELNAESRFRLRDEGRMEGDEVRRVTENDLLEIVNRFCSRSKASPRTVCFQSPPEYDPAAEKVRAERQLRPDIYEIETESTSQLLPTVYRYRLILENGEWKLYEKRRVGRDGRILKKPL